MGVPVYDDRLLFEMLILEGAQAGLSWEAVLKKRQGYRDAFYNFDAGKVANMNDEELEALRGNEKIIRNRQKRWLPIARTFRTSRREEVNSFTSYSRTRNIEMMRLVA